MSEWSGRDAAKDTLRERMWAMLADAGASVGDAHGHIPDFVGADTAAGQLAASPIWAAAHVIKTNPDSAQAPVRRRALEHGKTLYMAVPRLLDERCFVALTAESVRAQGGSLEEASLAKRALELGTLVAFNDMRPIDLVVVGCLAVTRGGGRTGKGAGFADIELGLLRHFGRVSTDTPIVTTVHPLQIVNESEITMRAHDSALNLIATPDGSIETHTRYPQPTGILWDQIQADQFEKIPVLRALRPG
jgi:5-formyltetrahydrofolate cyclo-ligase